MSTAPDYMDIPPGAIATADLYRELITIRQSQTRFDERMSVLTGPGGILPDHESRLRVLERFRLTVLGAAVGVSVVSGSLSAVIVHVLTSGGKP